MIKAIETIYKGYRFRSRLEARWAVFLDDIGAEWEYEPEGFDLPDGSRYLPDFFVRMSDMIGRYPGSGYWLEIKGDNPSAEEIRKLEMVVDGGVHHGYFAYGLPGKNKLIPVSKSRNRVKSEEEIAAWEVLQSLSGFKKAEAIMNNPVSCLFFSAIVACCSKHVGEHEFFKSIEAARSARFEFGESGTRRSM